MEEFDEILGSYINGKSIAIVGPSSGLDGKGLGAEIDAHDIVIKINNAFRELCPTDFGKRCDILFTVMRTSDTGHIPFLGKSVDACIKKGVRLCLVVGGYGSLATLALETLRAGGVKTTDIPNDLRTDMDKRVGAVLNTGICAIMCCSDLSPSKISIYGFDFHQRFYTKGYSNKSFEDMVSYRDRSNIPTGHCLAPQKEWLKNLIETEDNIFYDDLLKEALNLEDVLNESDSVSTSEG